VFSPTLMVRRAPAPYHALTARSIFRYLPLFTASPRPSFRSHIVCHLGRRRHRSPVCDRLSSCTLLNSVDVPPVLVVPRAWSPSPVASAHRLLPPIYSGYSSKRFCETSWLEQIERGLPNKPLFFSILFSRLRDSRRPLSCFGLRAMLGGGTGVVLCGSVSYISQGIPGRPSFSCWFCFAHPVATASLQFASRPTS